MKKKYNRAEYEEYLQSNQWQSKRRQKAEEQNYFCQKCHKKVLKGFHIHHLTYKRLKNERLSDLMFLCEDCHKTFHKTRKNGKNKPKNRIACPYCKSSLFIIAKSGIIFPKHYLYCNKCNKKIGKIILKKL